MRRQDCPARLIRRGGHDPTNTGGNASHDGMLCTTPKLTICAIGTTDHDKLVAALRALAPDMPRPEDRRWRREPAVRVLDCVLSLNRNYDAFSVPRLERFEQQYPDIRTISELQRLLATYQSADLFLASVLNYRHAQRGIMLEAVVAWLSAVSGNGSYAEQLANLQAWAESARPSYSTGLRIRRFGLKGFQYLRMLFGANTTVPDVHVRRWVVGCIAREVTDVKALQLLEHAAREAGVSLRDFDSAIWERSARHCS